MMPLEERRRRGSATEEWLREAGSVLRQRMGERFREAAARAWEGAVQLLATAALVATAAVFLLMGSVQLLKELRLPGWLAYGLLGLLGLLAGFLLWRSALPAPGRR